MVSHNWGNLFRDLVAAIVADALDETEFESMAYFLDHNFDNLVRCLRNKERLQTKYWICCFAVNQHASICGENHDGAKDPVLQQLHPICNCGHQKFGNFDQPVDEYGRSIPCELNKFHDMISFLAASYDSVEHLIAVDVGFEVFNRAWVVAEIAAAHAMGMHQSIKLQNALVLKNAHRKLKDLDVRQMAASRPEDVEEVLQVILDKVEFNEHLQDLIFGSNGQDGLLSSWKGLDCCQRMDRIGRIAKLSRIAHVPRSGTLFMPV